MSLHVGYLFGEFHCLPVDDCSAVSCESGALTRGSESTSSKTNLLNELKALHFWPRWSNKDWIYPLAGNNLKPGTICEKNPGFRYYTAKNSNS